MNVNMQRPTLRLLGTWMLALVLTGWTYQAALAAPDAQDSPPVFVQDVSDKLLAVLKSDPAVRNQDIERINEIVEQYVMPYVDFEKTTRLAAGKYWRQATPEQRQALVDAFRMTLVRTYSGALARIDDGTGNGGSPVSW